MIVVLLGIILMFALVMFVGKLINRNIIKRALRKYILPKLEMSNLTFLDYKWAGLFSHKDFKDPEFTFIVWGNGNPNLSIYIYVHYLDAGVKKRVTAEIDTFLFVIKSVNYSAEF